MRAADRHGRSTVICGMLLLLVLFLFPQSADAQEDIYIDHGSSLMEYARTVAELNRENIVLTERGGSAAEQMIYAVLCRTSGGEADFEGLSPLCVVAGPDHCYTAYFASYEQAQTAVEQLSQQQGMRYAECDAQVRAVEEETAQAYSFQTWAAPVMGFDSYLVYASEWCSASAKVAVIDSGTCPHPLISPRMLSGGYDYIDGDEEPTNDLSGHGTAVAGIIVDCTPGMEVYVLPIKVLDARGNGMMSNVVNAVREAIRHGVDVINLSLESTIMSQALDDAIADALNAGITVVTAAGNSGVHTSGVCPAHLRDQGLIVVGGAEYSSGSVSRASYSNYGESVDVYAFGTGIRCCSRSGGYVSGTGTSYAAPHISALCALLHTLHPGISPGEVEARIRAAAQSGSAGGIPALEAMIPASMGMHLVRLTMSVGERLSLPETALPVTAMERIALVTSDEGVASAAQGVLEAHSPGCCIVRADCPGLETLVFEVNVTDEPAGTVLLPEGLIALEDEAFMDAASIGHVIIPEGVERLGSRVFDGCTALRTVTLPATVMDIGENGFSDAVLICPEESTALTYAVANEMQYVITAD